MIPAWNRSAEIDDSSMVPREAVLEYSRNAHREKCWELKEMHTEKA